MAALDDELEADLPGYIRPRSVYETGEDPAAPVSALDGEEEDVGYGGGGDDLAGAGAALARMRPAPAGSARAALRQTLEQRLAERQAAPAAPAGFGVIGRDPAALERMIVPDAGEVMYTRPEPEKPPEEERTWTSILGRGLQRANEGLMQGKDIAEGKKPRTSKTEAAEYEKPMELADFLSPTTLAEKTVFSLAASYPAVALSIAGTLAGGAIGGAVTGPAAPIGGTVGGIVGGAAGMGLGAAFQELGPAYHAELEALGENPTQEGIDKAWDNALVQVGKTGAVNAASMALLGAGKPLSNALKGLWTKPVLDAAGKAAPVVAGVPTRVGVQVAGQPAVAVSGEVVANAIQGKPLTENLDPAAAGSIANVAADVAAMAGGRLARGVGRRIMRRGEVTPGVSDDQAAALEQYGPPEPPPQQGPQLPQGQLPLEGGAGVRPPAPQGELPLAGGVGERPPVQGEQLRLPDITGPGRQPLGDIVPPVPGPEPVQGQLPFGQEEIPGMGRPPPTAGPPPPGTPPGGGPPSPPGGAQGELPLIPPVRPSVGPAEQLALAEPATQLPLPLATPEAPVPRPGPAQPEIPGLGMPAARPGVQPELPGVTEPGGGIDRMAPGEAARSPIGAVEQPAELPPSTRGPVGPPVGGRTPEGWTTERDHTGPGYVVKNADGNVIAVGDTAEQAVGFARARAPDQVKAAADVPAEQAKPAATGTKEQLVSAGEKAPPAGAAKPEPAARGREAVPETPTVETPAPSGKGRKLIGITFHNRNIEAVDIGSAAERDGLRTSDTLVRVNGKQLPKSDAVVERMLNAAKDTGEVKLTVWGADGKIKELTFSGEDVTEAATTPRKAKKAVSEAKAAEVKAKGEARAKPPQGERDVTTLTGPQWNAPNVVNSFREDRQVGRDIREGRVTKPTESSAQKSAPKTEAEGTRTKSGAYVSPGEATEPQAPRPTARTQSDLQREVAADAARARREGLVSPATRRMAEAPTPTEKFPLTPGLETTRKARQVVENILAGQSLTDAIKAFGKKEPGTVGRPRNVQSLSSHIRQFLKEADTGTVEQSRQRAMDAAVAKLKKLPPEPVPGEASPQRRAILDDLDKLLKSQAKVRAERARLEDAATQIEALEAGSRGPKSIRRRITELVSGSTTPFEFLARRREVNEPILQHIQRSGAAGASLHRVLDDFIANKNAGGMTPQLTELAGILRRVVPDGKVRQGEGIIPGDAVGSYDPVGGDIYLNTNAARQEGNAAVTLLHETVHKPTVEYINHLYRTPEANLNPQELAHKFALESIRGEIDRVFVEGGPRTRAEDFELGYAGEMYDTPYLTGPHELAAQLLTQPELHRFLSRETASPEFRRALDSVGMGIPQKASIWDGFRRIVRNFFGVPDKLDSVFDYVLRPLTEIVETGARFGRAADVAEINQIRRQNNEVLGPAKLRDYASLKQIRDALGDSGGPKGRSVLRGVFQAATLGAIHDAIKPYVPSVSLHRAALEAVTHASEAERTRPVTTHGANGQPIVEPHIDKTMRLVNELKRGPDGDKVQPLMTEATLAEVSLTDPTKNTHMVTPEQQAVVARLQYEFDALDPRAQQTYREVNELYNDRDRVAREARVRQYTEAALPDLTTAQHNDVVRHMSTLGGIEDIVNNTDQSALAGRLGARWANSKDLVTLLAETERGGFVRGDYFPANRYGEYVVSAGTPNTPNYIVRMFEKPSEAKDFKAYLEAGEAADPSRNIPARAGRSDVSQVFTKSKQGFTAGMRLDQALGTLDRAMERSGLSEDAQRVLRDLYSGQLIQQGTRMSTRTMRREGIAGASIEQARNLMVDFLGHSSRVGHLKHQGEVLRSQFQMEKERDMLHRAGHGTPTGVDAQGNPIYAPSPQASRAAVTLAQLGTEELRTRLAPVDGDITSDLMGRGTRGLTTLTVADALIRPAHLVMQLAGTHAAAMSLIAGRHGISSVFGLTRAYAQLASPALRGAGTNAMAAYHRELKAANWDLAKLYRERLYRADDISNQHVDLLIDELNRSNLINQTKIREMQRMAGPDGWLGANGPINFIGRTLDIFGAGEHALDSMMRTATAKAAFVAELRKNGGDVTGAIEYAKQTARNALPDYNHYNKSRLASAQSSLGKYGAPLITQFKQFGLHMYGVQGNLIAEGIRNAKGTEARREAWKSLAYLQGSHALMYGGIGASIFGSLPAMVGFGLYDYLPEWLGGEGADRPHTNKEMQTRARTWVRDISGSKTLADVFDRGLPMTLGVDVHRSLKFTNLLGIPELQTFDAKGYGEFMLELMTGAAGGTATDLAEAASKVRKGDIRVETIAKLMPRVIEDPLTAYQWSQHGLKTGKGDRTIVPAEKFTTGDIVAKGLGFIPSRSSDAREARAMINLDQKVVEDTHKNILDRLVRAKGNERSSIFAEITRYNTAARPEDRITGQQIQSRLRDQARVNAQPQLYGMDVPKRDTRAAIEMTRAYR